MDSRLATFSVSATVEQGAAWKRAAELAGHLSIGTWLAEAADVHALPRPRALPAVPAALVAPSPSPISLSWRRGGRFPVVLEDGEEIEREGLVSPPFGIFRGHALAREYTGVRSYVLVYIPERRILGSFRIGPPSFPVNSYSGSCSTLTPSRRASSPAGSSILTA